MDRVDQIFVPIEFWTVEGKHVVDDFYWSTSDEIYDKKLANSTYNKLKNKYKVIRMIHHVKKHKIIKEHINE